MQSTFCGVLIANKDVDLKNLQNIRVFDQSASNDESNDLDVFNILFKVIYLK